jgi:hypothetical protein
VGGPGAGHKSERARRARLVNMAKARAARKRAPRPWRSGVESRVIEQLVWQWWLAARQRANTGLVGDPAKTQQRINTGCTEGPKATGGPSLSLRINEREAASEWKPQVQRKTTNKSANREIGDPRRPWAKQRVAELVGVSHTWVNKLVKRFEADPERMRRRMAAFAPATMEKLERAREETRKQRELGWLRGPIRMRRVTWTLGGRKQRAIVWTHAERRRRAEAQQGGAGARGGGVRVPYGELPGWARGVV